MLQLTSAAFRKVTAWRHLMARARLDRPIVEQDITWHREGDMTAAGGDTVAPRRDADNLLAHFIAGGMAATKSSAIIAGPAISAARP